MTSSPPRRLRPHRGTADDAREPKGFWTHDLALFFTARSVARLGDMMLPVALAAGLVQHGYAAGGVGLALASYTACFAGFVIFGGVFADLFGPRRLMIGADLVRVGTQSTASALFFSGNVTLWHLCAIGAANGVCAAFFQPGIASTVPSITNDVQKANGVIRTGESVMAVLGPAFAGVLIGVASVGWVFAAHAATYLVSALCLCLLRSPTRAKARPKGFFAGLAGGWQEFRTRTWIWSVIVIWMVFMVTVWGPTIPLAATELITRHGERAYGIVNSGLGAGMAVGGLLALRIRPVRPLRAGAIALFGFALEPLTVGARLPLAGVTLGWAVAGGAMAFWSVMWATSIQTQLPNDVLNRISAYEVAGSVAMMPVGQMIAGPASGVLGNHQVLLASAALALCTCTALLAVPAIRNLVRVDAAG
ncbi:MFS transporter [Streptomyces mirabilis]|uniref:MFS transporter n=1 Tax=Streptomyces mirabilis TaxID=68239 RepID=UPI003636E505